MVWRVCCPCGEVHVERFVGRERLLHIHPPNGLVSHVCGEMVIGVVNIRENTGGTVIHHRVPLVGFTADEAVKFIESGTCRPAIVGARH